MPTHVLMVSRGVQNVPGNRAVRRFGPFEPAVGIVAVVGFRVEGACCGDIVVVFDAYKLFVRVGVRGPGGVGRLQEGGGHGGGLKLGERAGPEGLDLFGHVAVAVRLADRNRIDQRVDCKNGAGGIGVCGVARGVPG